MLIDLVQNRQFSYSTYICQQYLNPNYTKIACLDATIYNMQIKKSISSPSEFTFDVSYVYSDIDSTYNSNIDILVSGSIILLESKIDDVIVKSDYFYVSEVVIKSEGGINSKSCKCFSLEYKMNFLKMPPMDIPTFLYIQGSTWDDAHTTSSGILNYIVQVKLLNTWSIGTVSASLLNWKQNISFSRSSVLSVFKQLEEQFNCIFEFISSTRTINVYSYDDLPDETGLILSDTNYINSIRNTHKMDEVVTRLIVYGKNSETIRGVNITKQDYIDNFEYFKNFMSASLQSALTAYEIKLAGLDEDNTDLLADLQLAQDAYLDLHYNPTNGLYTLQTTSLLLENNLMSATKLNDSASYTSYYNQKVAVDAQIALKAQAILTQQGVIDGIKAQRDALAVDASYDNIANFTSAQKLELLSFVHEDTVNAATSEANDIMRFGREVLSYRSQPPIEYDVDIIDLLSALNEGYAVDKIVLGAKINIIDSELNISTSARITSIDHNYENSNLKLTISNKNMLNDPMTYMMNILAKTTNENKNLLSERDFYKNYTSTYPLENVQADTTSGSNIATIIGTISNLTIGQYIYITGSIDSVTGENVVYRITGVNGATVILDKNVNVSVTDAQVYNVSPESALGTFASGNLNVGVNNIPLDGDSVINQNGISLNSTTNNIPHTVKLMSDGLFFFPVGEGTPCDSWIKYDGIRVTNQWSFANSSGKVNIDGQKIQTTNMYLDMISNANQNEIIIDPTYGILLKKGNDKLLELTSSGNLLMTNGYISLTHGSNTIKIDPSLGIDVKNGLVTKFSLNSSTGAVSINDGYITLSNTKSRSFIDPTRFTIEKNTGTVPLPVWVPVFDVDGNGDLKLAGNITSTATITGGTIQTANSGARMVFNSSGIASYILDGTDKLHGLQVNPLYADLITYYYGNQKFSIMQDVGSSSINYGVGAGATRMTIDATTTYFNGTVSFSGATVSGFQVCFA